ncbi:hypothetical protein HI914_02081 [Erysiphe necator]|nr:hypothetical protein HI914_02081 [Erysiphe necator]
MAGVEAGATQAIGKNAVQTSEKGEIQSSQVAIEKIGDVLKKMKGCLNKIGLKGMIMMVEEVDEAIEVLNNKRFIWLHATQNNSLEHRMLALEEAVKKNLVEKCGQMSSKGVVGKSYASVVALPAAKAAVRIRVPGTEELQPAELLSIAKQKIKGAYAIRQMRSHDTEVFVQSSNHRDAVLSMEQPKEFKILRKDFPVEIAGVPLSTKIASEKNADNSALISILSNASKMKIPGLQTNRIRWLQGGKEHEKARKKGHTRGSVILSLPTEELQWRVIRNGIVIDSILYSAQIWTPKAQTKQCFNCSQWGHVQARAVCKTLKVYKEGVERARLENQIKTVEIRSEKIPATESKYVPVNTSDEEGFTIVTRKGSETKRGPGRPRKDALAPMKSQIIATSHLLQKCEYLRADCASVI